jgi:hypothetical protein
MNAGFIRGIREVLSQALRSLTRLEEALKEKEESLVFNTPEEMFGICFNRISEIISCEVYPVSCSDGTWLVTLYWPPEPDFDDFPENNSVQGVGFTIEGALKAAYKKYERYDED